MSDTEPKPVYIEWEDITCDGAVWFKIADIEGNSEYAPSTVRSIGYVLQESKAQIVITSTYHLDEAIHSIVIPRAVIKRLEYLTIPEASS